MSVDLDRAHSFIFGKTPSSAYIANAMRGFESYNFPWFDRATTFLNGIGVKATSPADMDRELGFNEDTDPFTDVDLYDAIRRDTEAILSVDAIALGPDWEKSTGATAEYHIALWAQKEVWYVDPDHYLFAPLNTSEGF